MIKIRKANTDTVLKIAILGLVLGLFFSNALKSISIVLLSVGFLFNENWIELAKSVAKNRLFQSAVIIFAIYIMSGILGGSFLDYIESIKGKLFYFSVPITVSLIVFNFKDKIVAKFFFACCAIVQSLYALKIFIVNKESLIDTYSTGNVLPVIKIHHVQIAVLIAISILLLVSVLFSVSKNWIKLIAYVLVIWLFIFLHLFAVRTGLILVYGMLILYISIKLIERKKWTILAGTLIIIIGLGATIINYSPTIKNKINYMQYDLLHYKQQSNDLYFFSDSRRLQSIQIGIQILNEHPLTGCGIGNIEAECARIYKQKNKELNASYYYLPHSQYIYFLSCFGWIAGSILIACFLYPLLYFLKQKKYLFTTIYSGLIVFGIWDAFLGTLFGNCVYILIIGLGLQKDETNTARK